MSTSAPFDAGIPVLTEVLQEIPPAPASSPAPAPAAAPAPIKPAVWRTGASAAASARVPEVDFVVPAEEPGPAKPIEESGTIDAAALEQALSERILQELMPRVEALVAERLEQALQDLASGLRAGLGESIAQVVAIAVQRELADWHAREE